MAFKVSCTHSSSQTKAKVLLVLFPGKAEYCELKCQGIKSSNEKKVWNPVVGLIVTFLGEKDVFYGMRSNLEYFVYQYDCRLKTIQLSGN